MPKNALLRSSAEQTQYDANRHRVSALLEDAVKNPLVILSAGSGFGKTVAVKAFVSQTKENVVWLHLTSMVTSADRFWNAFILAVAPWSKQLAEEMEQVGFPSSLSAVHSFLHNLTVAAQRDGSVIMVFDDFHLLPDGPAKALITSIIESKVQQVSCILLMGEEVSISLSGDVRPIQLTERHLQFTREEIRVYYTALGIVMDDTQLNAVHQLTEGWAVMVYMMGLHLQRHELLTQRSIDNAATYLFSMFDREILETLSAQVQQDLILLSQLDEFPLELVEDLTALDSTTLQILLKNIPMIRFRPVTSSLYFHNLFRQFLNTKQILLSKKIRYAFLRKAAAWYEKRGKLVEPLTYYLGCKDFARMARVLEQTNLLQLRGDACQRAARLLDEVDVEYYQQHPLFWLRYTYLLLASGNVEKGNAQHKLLKYHLQDAHLDDEGKQALGESHILDGFISIRYGDYSFVRYFKLASELLPNGTSLFRGSATHYIGTGQSLPFAGSGGGSMLEMKEALFQSAPYTQKLFGSWGRGAEQLAAAEAHYYRGEFPQSVPYAGEAIINAAKHKQWDIACCACYLLVRTSIARGLLAEAEFNRKQVHDYAERMTNESYFVLADIADFHFYYHVGRVDESAQWIKEDSLLQMIRAIPNVGRELYVRAVYLEATKQYYPALSFIDTAMGVSADTGQWFCSLNLYILKAVLYNFLHQPVLAARTLQQAYKMSMGNGIIMPFAEYGSNMQGLIASIQALPKNSHEMPPGWLKTIDDAAGLFAKNLALLVKDYYKDSLKDTSKIARLTVRERDTLALLCKGLSNEEIADRMSVEVNSVKTAITRICRKIDAPTRAEAVRIGLSEGILNSKFTMATGG